jgi:hypothetical protein
MTISGITGISSSSSRAPPRFRAISLLINSRPGTTLAKVLVWPQARDLLYMDTVPRSIAVLCRSCDPRRYVANAHCRLSLGNALP